MIFQFRASGHKPRSQSWEENLLVSLDGKHFDWAVWTTMYPVSCSWSILRQDSGLGLDFRAAHSLGDALRRFFVHDMRMRKRKPR